MNQLDQERWNSEEQKKLAPFFTNLDQDVFGLKLPQEVAGALFSRYSRSNKSLRRTFIDEFLGNPDLSLDQLVASFGAVSGQEEALKKARAFYDRVLVGYGDDSVAQLGGAHLACENISNLAANVLEDARLGIAPLEKSTRYVRFDRKNTKGEYPYYREPRLMTSPHSRQYLEVMDRLFEVYSNQLDSVIEKVESSLPFETMTMKHPQTGEQVELKEIQKDQGLAKWARSAYRSTVRAHACDILRSFLPMATKTNVGLFGVGQAFEYLLSKFYSHPLGEMKTLGASMHRELNQLIPSFVKRAGATEYQSTIYQVPRELSKRIMVDPPTSNATSVQLIDYDEKGEDCVLAAILFPGSRHSLIEIQKVIMRLSLKERKEILSDYLKKRRSRRDKPGRALENSYYTFDILCNIGIYRDLHRHRILTQERQAFTVDHGYETPPEMIEMGYQSIFDECMERAADLYRKIEQDTPDEAQYVVPFAYRVRWYMTVNLRELYHIIELRTMPQGHPDYRLLSQQIWKEVQAVHPVLAGHAKFVDWNTYRLGRLQSEFRTEYKKSALKKKDRSE